MGVIKDILKFICVKQWRIHKLVLMSVNNNTSLFIRNVIKYRLSSKYNICIGKNTKIDSAITFPHPFNIVLGDEVSVGKNCIIYQNVTLGQNKELYPVIGDNVTIYVGATIVGGIEIGEGAIIGANSLVNKNVPCNSIVAGNPAKIIGYRG